MVPKIPSDPPWYKMPREKLHVWGLVFLRVSPIRKGHEITIIPNVGDAHEQQLNVNSRSSSNLGSYFLIGKPSWFWGYPYFYCSTAIWINIGVAMDHSEPTSKSAIYTFRSELAPLWVTFWYLKLTLESPQLCTGCSMIKWGEFPDLLWNDPQCKSSSCTKSTEKK